MRAEWFFAQTLAGISGTIQLPPSKTPSPTLTMPITLRTTGLDP